MSSYDNITASDNPKIEREIAPMNDGTTMTIVAPVKGKIISFENVHDKVLSEGIMGKGIAIEPKEGKIFAPVDGVVENIASSKNKITLIADNDANLLIHVGLDTMKLDSSSFNVKVEAGAKIKKGDLIMTFDLNAIQIGNDTTTTSIVICNSDDFKEINLLAKDSVNAGEVIMKIIK